MLKYCWRCRKYCNYDVFFKAYICRCGKEKIEEDEYEEIEEEIEEELEESESVEEVENNVEIIEEDIKKEEG